MINVVWCSFTSPWLRIDLLYGDRCIIHEAKFHFNSLEYIDLYVDPLMHRAKFERAPFLSLIDRQEF